MKALLNWILPPLCLSCGEIVQDKAGLCPDCWGKINFIAPPFCDLCGIPLAFASGLPAFCDYCNNNTPIWDKARSAFVYNQDSSSAIIRFKHTDKIWLAPEFARLMLKAGQDILNEADILAPVPLHWLRLFRRGYNQSALLAQEICKISGHKFLPYLLQRTRKTPTQGQLSRAQRLLNLENAIRVNPRQQAQLKDKNIVIIDDVRTTGATLEECCKTLKKSGANKIFALTLAVVP